ncbi:hypothetical protein [Pseudarthrobacter sulfonivorans]|nr:hypothetical protein [Pseudarthrobacter sulfonivorans]
MSRTRRWCAPPSNAVNVPFGGVKDSSTNTFREQGRSALDFFT